MRRFFILILLILIAQPAWASVTWQKLGGPDGGIVRCMAIDPETPQTLYAGTTRNIYKSTNGGSSWTEISSGIPDTYFDSLAIDPINPQTIYAGTSGYGVFKSADGGGSWSIANSGLTSNYVETLVIDPTTPQTLYAGTYEGVFKSINGGASWSMINTGIPAGTNVYSLAIDPMISQILYAGTREGVFKSINGGDSWSMINSGLDSPYSNQTYLSVYSLAIDPVITQTLYAGTGLGVFKSTNGGLSWAEASNGLLVANGHSFNLAIDPVTPQTLYAVADSNGAFKSSNGGATWTSIDLGGDPEVASVAVDPKTPQTVYIGTAFTLFKSLNGGSSWAVSDSGVKEGYIASLAVDPETPQTLYLGSDRVSKSTDGGASWSTVSSRIPAATNVDSLAIDPMTPQTLYAGTRGDGVFKSTDGGTSWSLRSSGLTSVYYYPYVYVKSLAIDPITPQTLYAGTHKEGIFKSIDGGASWSVVNTGLLDITVNSLVLDPENPATIYAGTWEGVFKSINGGDSWSMVSSGIPAATIVDSLVIDPVTTQTLYAGTYKGVFKSTDGGLSWTEISSGIPATSINSLVIDPMTPQTLYAGTWEGVFKSTDGGASWSIANGGLTDTWVDSLAIDPMTPEILYALTEDELFKGISETNLPVISGLPSKSTVIGSNYSFTPTATKATSFSIAGSVPPGLNFDTATGTLNGTPTTVGTYNNIIITAINSEGSDSLPAFSITVSALSALNDDTEFVKQVYLDFLNRAPDAVGLAYWADQLKAGTLNRSEMVEQYLLSAEFGDTISPVVRLYFTYYQRIPDYDGLMFWVNSYAAGMSLNDISDAFATAQEFIDTYGTLTNEQFISQMYVNVYGRQSDAGGLVYWTEILGTATLTRGQVMVEFSSAEEYLSISANQVYVTMTYMGLLRRAPDQGGFDFWVESMDLGVSGLGLIDGFLASDEYAARFDGLNGGSLSELYTYPYNLEKVVCESQSYDYPDSGDIQTTTFFYDEKGAFIKPGFKL